LKLRPPSTGRSDLLWGLASFVALQLGLAIAVERWLPELRDPVHASKACLLARRLAAPGPRPPTVVMVGSSRVEYGLLGRAIEDSLTGPCGVRPVVFNFGISGAGPIIELLTLQRLLRDGPRPDVVLVEVVPSLLAGQFPAWDLQRLTPDRLGLDELPWIAPYGPSLAMRRIEWLRASAVPWYTHRIAMLSCGAPLLLPGPNPGGVWQELDEAGGMPLPVLPPPAEQYRRAFARATREHGEKLASLQIGGPAVQALHDLLDLCRREHIVARLVMMPEGSDFRALYPPQAWAQVERFLNDLARQYDCPLINAREWVADDHFADGHHLLRPGAAIFSERLGREYLLPLLIGTRP
jgi:hypothetical protein